MMLNCTVPLICVTSAIKRRMRIRRTHAIIPQKRSLHIMAEFFSGESPGLGFLDSGEDGMYSYGARSPTPPPGLELEATLLKEGLAGNALASEITSISGALEENIRSNTCPKQFGKTSFDDGERSISSLAGGDKPAADDQRDWRARCDPGESIPPAPETDNVFFMKTCRPALRVMAMSQRKKNETARIPTALSTRRTFTTPDNTITQIVILMD